VIDGFGAQFVVPGLVAVDLAQPVLGAVFGQPRRGIGVPDVDRVSGHVRRRVRSGDPSGSFLFRAVLGDRLAKKLILVLGGAPSAVDVEVDAVVSGICRRFAQGPEQIGVEVGYAGILVINTATPSGRAPSASVVVPPWSPRRTSLNEGAGDDAD
jgi:hypothetical protein